MDFNSIAQRLILLRGRPPYFAWTSLHGLVISDLETMVRYHGVLARYCLPPYSYSRVCCSTGNQVHVSSNGMITCHEEYVYFVAQFAERTEMSTPMLHTCAVCTGTMEDGDVCMLFECSHGAHPSCFFMQALVDGRCAICGCRDSTLIYVIVFGDPAQFLFMPY
uniref:RING-type domain-containing protein n=1 Tax=Trichuris muris TaxID=70415 RepID=A0A5S6QC89_TRIMR